MTHLNIMKTCCMPVPIPPLQNSLQRHLGPVLHHSKRKERKIYDVYFLSRTFVVSLFVFVQKNHPWNLLSRIYNCIWLYDILSGLMQTF